MLKHQNPSVRKRYLTWYSFKKEEAILTFSPLLLLDDKYILGLSNSCVTTRGVFRCRELEMCASICGGADAVRAMNGALVKARKPPSFENAVRKSFPLQQTRNKYKHIYMHQLVKSIHTTPEYNVPHQWLQEPGCLQNKDF